MVHKLTELVSQCYRRFTSSLVGPLTVMTIILISLPTLIFTIVTLQRQSNITRRELTGSAYDSTVQIANQVNSELRSYASVSNLFYLDDTLNQALLSYNAGQLSFQEAQQQFRIISDRYNAGVANRTFSVLIVAEDGTAFGNAVFADQHIRIPLDDHAWNDSLSITQTRQLYVGDPALDRQFASNGYSNIYLVRRLHDHNSWQSIGTLILVISQLEIERIYSSYVTDTQSLFILDRNLNTVSSVDNLRLPDFPPQVRTQLLSYSGTCTTSDMGRAGLISYYTIGTTQWKLVYCHDTENIMQPYRKAEQGYILLMCICLTVSVMLSIVMVKRYISPIKTLREQMDEVQKGNLESHIPVVGNNEIGQLTAHFNLMQDSIHLLMQRLIEESEAKRDAEIKALQSQINPHFLYNTLASVRYMIFSGKRENADTIVVSLIHLLKNALSDSCHFVTVDMELRLLDDYIRIQQYTFAEPFRVETDIAPEIRDCYMIKLLLQPIVENAIFHGLKPKGTDCLLQIIGRVEADGIDLIIRDNGVGYDPEHPAPSASRLSNGIGIKNVNDRVQRYFGAHYGIHVTSAIGAGTEVRLHLPRLETEEDCKVYEHSDRGR